VILVNLSNQALKSKRRSVLLIAKHDRADWVEVQRYLKPRGEGGFGSTRSE
jgi:dUTPase